MVTGGLAWGTLASGAGHATMALRPPGAATEKEFSASCIKCGQCLEACPYDSLKLAEPGQGHVNGTPHFEPRETPCYMCPSYPCTVACPSGALKVENLNDDQGVPTINESTMGVAVVHKESCVAFWGIQCDACYRACPLIGEAIKVEYVKNEVTGKHANLQPVVDTDYCTGCGICEHVCIVEEPAIRVFPVEIATGKFGDHYIRSWIEGDEQRIKTNNNVISPAENLESALDYLNDSDPKDE